MNLGPALMTHCVFATPAAFWSQIKLEEMLMVRAKTLVLKKTDSTP